MNIDELKKYGNLKGLNLGQAEKDYYQNIILFIFYNKASKDLVFKGGTALAKCYGLNRFSEDLDFTLTNSADFIELIENGLSEFGISNSIKEIGDAKNSKKYKIKIEGPLYKGSEKTLCSITIDFSLREKILMDPNITTIGYHMDIIPVFDVYVMKKEEVMSEKVRAIMTRKSARDLYDLVFLIRLGVVTEKEIVNEKLKLYNITFDEKEFNKRCLGITDIWGSELKSLVKNVPDIEEYLAEIEKFSWIK
ncbi:MAG: nucleotidyl transferase AbiEii/AbiGii toxin family protein [Candidatus Micrarchaeota archaeon]|nr:nucleotidyl transferase AbiEii/AbiGii toxin family protein [Candidatus Micrarchaeota archaeon]